MAGIPTYIILVFIWFFSLVAWLPVILYLKSTNDTNIIHSHNRLFDTIRERNSTRIESLTYDCTVPATPNIIIPHSILVYYTPMFLIFMFYSKTIRIVSQKIKKRRSSTVSIRYLASMIAENTNNNEFLLASRNSIINSRRPSNVSSILKISNKEKSSSMALVNSNETPDIAIDAEKNIAVKKEALKETTIIIRRENFDDPEDKSDFKYHNRTESFRDSLSENKKRKSSKNSDKTEKISTSSNIYLRPYSSLNNISQIQSQKFDKSFVKPLLPRTSSFFNNSHLRIERPSLRFKSKKSNGSEGGVIVTPFESDNSSDATLKNGSSIGILKKSSNSSTNLNMNKKKLSFCSSYQDLESIKFKSQLKRLKASDRNKSSNSDFNIENNSVINSEGATNRRKISFCSVGITSNRSTGPMINVTYKLGFIMFAFLICWLPFSIFWPLMSLCKTCVNENMYIFSFWLAYANSIFTPLILAYNNAKYRQAIFMVKKMICAVFSPRKEVFNTTRRESFFVSNIHS